MLLLIDNYDSFVYNLAHIFEELGQEIRVVRSDAVTVGEVLESSPDAVVLSPGPGDPAHSGICVPLVRQLHAELPILGVCLGHQAIARAFGARVSPSGCPAHGVASEVFHDGRGIFDGLPNPFVAGRYHSLVVDPHTLPPDIEVTAVARERTQHTVMALRHRSDAIVGLQFHPESVLSPLGHRLIENFLRQAGLTIGGQAPRGPQAHCVGERG